VESSVLTGLTPLFFLFLIRKNYNVRRSLRAEFIGLLGFEAMYAVAGLIAVAFLVMRRRISRKARFIAFGKSYV
jgi:PGF-CTERM motif